jgi:integrase
MENSPLPPIPPATVNRTVRRPNAQLRTREHLTDEVERLIETVTADRQGHRDALMILLAFRHGLRAAEVCDLRWEQVDFKAATLHVRRTKNGTAATHPLTGDPRRWRADDLSRAMGRMQGQGEVLKSCTMFWRRLLYPRGRWHDINVDLRPKRHCMSPQDRVGQEQADGRFPRALRSAEAGLGIAGPGDLNEFASTQGSGKASVDGAHRMMNFKFLVAA